MRELDLTETPRLRQALVPLRTALLAAAADGRALTYGEASQATGGVYSPRGMGRLLELVGAYCAANGEPDLAALVVRPEDREARLPERRRCWRHWGGEDAERAGQAREVAAAEQAQRAEQRRTSAPKATARTTAASAGAHPPAPRAAAKPEPAPLVTCPRCFTVKSASGACACD